MTGSPSAPPPSPRQPSSRPAGRLRHRPPSRADIEAQVRATRAQLDAANAKVEARVGRNLPLAIFFGLALGGAFLVSLLFFKQLFILFGAALIGFTVFELASALRFAGRDVPRVVSIVLAVAVTPIAFSFDVAGLWLATLGAILVVTLWRLAEVLRPSARVPARELALDVGAGVLIQVYVTFMAGFFLVLTGKDGGQWWTMAAIVIVVVCDVGAYASGLLFGKHKMAPTISPGKTWEGFAGAAVFSTIAAILLATLLLGEQWWVGLILGPALLLTATAGDLTESLIKRDLGIKDISSWLPGHGGFLDRVDSILPSAAVAYVIFLLVA